MTVYPRIFVSPTTPRYHCTYTIRAAEAAGWRPTAAGALAWFVYSPGKRPTAAWLADVAAPWPDEPSALLTHFGAAAQYIRVATGTAVAWIDDTLTVAWAGDVRAVLVRDGQPVATTADHSLAREMNLPNPELDRVTRRHLGDNEPPERARWSTRPGDVLLLCSPDLHDFRPADTWLAAALDPTADVRGRLLLRAA